jgi:hypothetical protein
MFLKQFEFLKHRVAPSVGSSPTSAHQYKRAALAPPHTFFPSYVFSSSPVAQGAPLLPPPLSEPSESVAVIAPSTPPRGAAPPSSLTPIGPIPHLPCVLLRLQELVATLPGHRTPLPPWNVDESPPFFPLTIDPPLE